MGNPLRDPHGDLIPTPELIMPQDDSIHLSALRPQQFAVIQRVKTDDVNLLRYLEDLGLTPGIKIEVVNYSEFDNNITIKAGRQVIILGLNITTRIFVEMV